MNKNEKLERLQYFVATQLNEIINKQDYLTSKISILPTEEVWDEYSEEHHSRVYLKVVTSQNNQEEQVFVSQICVQDDRLALYEDLQEFPFKGGYNDRQSIPSYKTFCETHPETFSLKVKTYFCRDVQFEQNKQLWEQLLIVNNVNLGSHDVSAKPACIVLLDVDLQKRQYSVYITDSISIIYADKDDVLRYRLDEMCASILAAIKKLLRRDSAEWIAKCLVDENAIL